MYISECSTHHSSAVPCVVCIMSEELLMMLQRDSGSDDPRRTQSDWQSGLPQWSRYL